MPLPWPQFYFPLPLEEEDRSVDPIEPETSPSDGKSKPDKKRLPERKPPKIHLEQNLLQELISTGAGPQATYTVILGSPGGGKSTLLQQWNQRLLRQAYLDPSSPFPLLVKLKGQPVLTGLGEKVKHLQARERLPVVLLDGLDEYRDDLNNLGQTLRAWGERKPLRVIITCRNSYYQSIRTLKVGGIRELRQGRIDIREINSFLHTLFSAWHKATNQNHIKGLSAFSDLAPQESWVKTLASEATSHPQLNDLATNPLMLCLLAFIFQPGSDFKLPLNRAEFYQQGLEKLLQNRDFRPKDSTLVQLTDQANQVLRQLALTHQPGQEARYSPKDLNRAYLASQSHISQSELVYLLRESGVLLGDDSDPDNSSYEWYHQTFHEFYLAQHLAQTDALAGVKEYWDNKAYNETLSLTLALIKDPKLKLTITKFLLEIWRGKRIRSPDTRSGVRTALKLWGRSGLDLATENPQVLESLVAAVDSRKYPLRALSVVMDFNIPIPVIEKLAGSKNRYILLKLIDNPRLPVSVYEKLATSKDKDLLGRLAGNLSLPTHLLGKVYEKLGESEDEYMSWNLPRNPNLPISVFEELEKSEDKDLLRSLAENPSLPVSMYEKLAESEDKDLLQSLAGNPGLPISVFEKLAESESGYVVGRLAENPNLPVSMYEKLAESKDEYVLGRLAEKPMLPVSVSERLAESESGYVLERLAENPSLPVSMYEKLAESGVRNVIWRLAGNPSLPTHLLRNVYEKLAKSKNKKLLVRLAGNPGLPISVFEELEKSEDKDLLRKLAGNPSLPVSMYEKLAESEDKDILWSLAGNYKLLASVSKRLAESKDEYVLGRLAENPSLPVSMYEKLAESEVGYVIWRLAENPSLPVSVFEKLAESKDKILLRRLAGNPSIPLEIILGVIRRRNVWKILGLESHDWFLEEVSVERHPPLELLWR